MQPAWFSKSEMKKSLRKCCLVENYLELLSQPLHLLTVMFICGGLMLTTRPSLEEKGGSGRWQRGCSVEWPCFWNAFTVHPVGQCFRQEKGKWLECECGHGCHLYFFQHEAELFCCFYSTLEFLSRLLACFLTESAQVCFSPCQVFQQASFCSPLVYGSTLVLSLTVAAALFLWGCVATWNLAVSGTAVLSPMLGHALWRWNIW